MESTCRIVRGRVLLARGEMAGALADADAALGLAAEAEDLVGLHEALGCASAPCWPTARSRPPRPRPGAAGPHP
jgi:hypothetical protein